VALAVLFVFSPAGHLIAFIPVLLLLALNEWRLARRGQPYPGAVARFEGGGVKRGLTAAEAGLLLGKPFNLSLTLVFFSLLKKGMLRQVSDWPWVVEVAEAFRTRGEALSPEAKAARRRKAAQAVNAVLHSWEEPFLELLEANPDVPLSEIDYTVAVRPLLHHLAQRVAGFDLEASREYYRLIVQRAPKEARSDGVLTRGRQKVLDRNLEWVLLHEDFEAILDGEELSYVPVWLRDGEGKGRSLPGGGSFAQWARRVIESMEAAVPAEALQVKLGTPIDEVKATLLNEIAKATFYS